MSSDNSSSNSNNTPTKSTSDESSSASTMPSIDVGSLPTSFRQGIHQGVKMTVQATNGVLHQLQTTTNSIRQPIATVANQVEDVGTSVATQLRIAYDRRHEFGPYYVAGSTIGVGGLTALRRGRLPGVALGALAGGLTYVALYEPLMESPMSLDWPSLPSLPGSSSGGDKKE